MKQLFIGLLIIAAGAGIYFLLQKKKTEPTLAFEKELIIGKWKIDSLYFPTKDSSNEFIKALVGAKDSSIHKYQFEFQNNGTLIQTMNDSVKVDSSWFEWSKKNDLIIKQSLTDSVGEVFSVNKLKIDSLIVQSKDSAVFVLTKRR